MKRAMILLIELYQRYISRSIPLSCRFTPTCSRYAKEAIDRHGAVKGGVLASLRLLRCHPFHPGGYDPVPQPGIGEQENRGAETPCRAR